MLKRGTYLILFILPLVLIPVGLLSGVKPHVNTSAVSRWPLWLGALALNLLWLVLYLLVWRKNLTKTRHDGWYLLGGGILAVASVMLLCLVTLSFERS